MWAANQHDEVGPPPSERLDKTGCLQKPLDSDAA